MPRNSSGVYTLPATNPVITGTLITSTWANPTMSDIASQLNNVLTRDGLLGPTLPALNVDGSLAAPGVAFSGQPSTGLYRNSSVLGVSYAGLAIASFGPAGIDAIGITVPTQLPGANTNQVATTAFVAAQAFSSALPGQTGNAGLEITTNGTTAAWGLSPASAVFLADNFGAL